MDPWRDAMGSPVCETAGRALMFTLSGVWVGERQHWRPTSQCMRWLVGWVDLGSLIFSPGSLGLVGSLCVSVYVGRG